MFTYVSRFLIVYYSYSLVKFVNLIMMCIAEQAPVVAILKLKVLEPQGLVTIQVNILSMTMYKHIHGRTSFFTPARFKSCLFFKFLLIYSKPCLVQLLVVGCKYCYVLLHQCIIFFTVRDHGVYYPCNDDHIIVCYQSQDSNQMFI